MKNLALIVTIATVSTLVGCAYVPYARESKKKPREGGIISLHTDPRPEDRMKAESLMASNCGPGYMAKVLEEGEVAVGTRTTGQASRGRDEAPTSGFKIGGFSLGGSPGTSDTTNTASETTSLREWQISYICEKNR